MAKRKAVAPAERVTEADRRALAGRADLRHVLVVQQEIMRAGLGRDIDPGDKPFAGFFDQQRRAAISPGSRASMPQHHPAAGIGRTSDDTALDIRHQNEWMILLVATEPDGAPDLRPLADHRQDTIRRAKRREISAQSLPLVSGGVIAGSDLEFDADAVAGIAAAIGVNQKMQRPRREIVPGARVVDAMCGGQHR